MRHGKTSPSAPPEAGPEGYAPGAWINAKYQLESTLGEGAMGTVWLARNAALDSRVAIKLIRRDFDSSEAGDRLLAEARAVAKLGHPGIVRVFDFGQTDFGDPFIVMEVLEGRNLNDELKRSARLSPATAIRTLLPVAEALAVAHDKGIVHRDLKPDNIFLAREGTRTRPKVLDFGVAKIDYRDVRRELTGEGIILGSPGYMSPEQARGLDDVDHRADIWAYSVVLYECISGCAPFDADNYNALMRAIIEDPVRPTTDLSAGDARLWEIIHRGLAKQREDRWQSMREVGEALAAWLIGHGIDEDICGVSLQSTWCAWETALAPNESLNAPSGLPRARASGREPLMADLAKTVESRPDRGSAGSIRLSHGAVSVPSLAPVRRSHFARRVLMVSAVLSGVILLVLMLSRSAPEARPGSTGASSSTASVQEVVSVEAPRTVVMPAQASSITLSSADPAPPVPRRSVAAASPPALKRVKRPVAARPERAEPSEPSEAPVPKPTLDLKDPYE